MDISVVERSIRLHKITEMKRLAVHQGLTASLFFLQDLVNLKVKT